MDAYAAVERAVPVELASESSATIGPGEAPDPAVPVVSAAARSVPARLIEYASGCRIAVPVHATLEVLEPSPVVEVPGALAGWRGLLRWRGDWLPVVDLAERLGLEAAGAAGAHLLVLGWRPIPGEALRHGALVLRAMPTTSRFSDDDQCPIPTDHPLWPAIALSCVSHDGQAIPIVDPGRLFGD
ncbi:MAG: chemotaxis protein CheW [Limnobacter sp.]|nr:chemotaxis protein CheW [Limnobacter sp.]